MFFFLDSVTFYHYTDIILEYEIIKLTRGKTLCKFS